MKFLILMLLSFLASCTAFSIDKIGEEGQKCFTNGTCKNGLVCSNDICVDKTSGSDTSETDTDITNDGSETNDTAVTTDDIIPDSDADTIEEPLCNMGETCWGTVPTQQKSCFNDTKVIVCDEITSDFYGQDGLYADTYSRGFENVKYGEKYYLFDEKTKLLWYKTSTDEAKSHSDATAFCQVLNDNSMADKTNWRLPYLHEMVSIVNFDEKYDAGTDGFYFPFIKAEKYWTLTKLGNSADGKNYYYVDFSGDSQFYVEDGTTFTNYAICVSSEHDYNEERPFERYVEIPVDQDVTVEDKATGLVWQKVNDYSARVWKDALKYCQDLEFADKDDWRLPNINELHSIATYGLNYELQTTFPNLGDDFFWSSTTNAKTMTNAWVMEFKYGILKPELSKDKNENSIYTMCVRNKE